MCSPADQVHSPCLLSLSHTPSSILHRITNPTIRLCAIRRGPVWPPDFVSLRLGHSVKGFRCAPIASRRLRFTPPPLTSNFPNSSPNVLNQSFSLTQEYAQTLGRGLRVTQPVKAMNWQVRYPNRFEAYCTRYGRTPVESSSSLKAPQSYYCCPYSSPKWLIGLRPSCYCPVSSPRHNCLTR